ncbi:divergent PAP2 family protein, partial [Bacillus thuringiensis]|nr:divergent PAP2 family protein [Bacillus thuringiensis]
MGTYLYCVLPFIAWVASGVLKFLVNYLRSGKDAFRLVGNGGFPSTHTTILSSMVMTIGFHEGFNTPMFGIGMAILTIVIIDATGLRRTVGKHARMLNKHISSEEEKLR